MVRSRKNVLRRWVGRSAVGLAVAFLLIQLVPYGRDHENPPVVREPSWDSPGTRELVVRACFDCHSNEVRWPWYSHVAPASWLVQRDVDEAREKLNFSEFHRQQDEAEDAAEEVAEGEMPLGAYLLAHPEARLGRAGALFRGEEETPTPVGPARLIRRIYEADAAGQAAWDLTSTRRSEWPTLALMEASYEDSFESLEVDALWRELVDYGGFAGGSPLWLQNPELDGHSHFQFDEAVADVNLGRGRHVRLRRHSLLAVPLTLRRALLGVARAGNGSPMSERGRP